MQSLHGRWFGGQQLEVGYWDGVTNYQVEETDQEREQRLSKWENFLNEGNSGEEKTTVVESGVREGERQGVQDEVFTFSLMDSVHVTVCLIAKTLHPTWTLSYN